MSTKAKEVSEVQASVVEMRESVEGSTAADTKTLNAADLKLGNVVRQGDIYLTLISDLPEGKASIDMQLAPGESQGSRHILKGDVSIVEVKSFKNVNAALIGPAFKCNSAVEVTHPEHGNVILPEGTIWQTTYQQSYADEVRRVQD